MVHITLQRLVLRPLHVELKDILCLLDSLKKENKLWSSIYRKESVDLSLSANIILFAYRTYNKFGLKGEIEASLNALKSLLKVKLCKAKDLSSIPREDLLDILLCAVAVLKYCRNDEVHELVSKLYNEFYSENRKKIISVMSDYNPYTTVLPSLIALTVIYQKKHDFNSAELDKTINFYIDSVKNIKENSVDPSAVYWITEALKELADSVDYQESIIISLKQVEAIVADKLASRKNSLEHLSLDAALWYCHTIENLIEARSKLGLTIEQHIRKLHNSILKHIITTGSIVWKKTTYAEVLRGLRDGQAVSVEPKWPDIDLVTLSLLIGAYDRAERHIVTYITDYDLRQLSKVEKITFFIGTTSIIVGSFLAGTLRQNLFLSLEALLIAYGCSLLYSLLKQEIKKYPDLVLILLKLFKKMIRIFLST